MLDRHIHDLLCAGIVRTAPLEMRPAPVSICSLVCSRDFLMYLVAIKSFYAQLGAGRVVGINDGSLTARQISILRDHIPGIVLLDMRDIPRRRVPGGGCWERLLAIVQLAQSDYVIQLDSDTLTRRPLAEILDACTQKRPFILAGDQLGAQIVPRQAASQSASARAGNHIQAAMERQLGHAPALKPFYVRGCAGFFGIPPGSLCFEDVEAFSDAMRGILGARWDEWGTEQATVNYLLANLAGTVVLQPPKYTQRWKASPGDESAFIHFIGTHRFDRQWYAFQSRRIIRQLRQPLFKPGALGPGVAAQAAGDASAAAFPLPESSRQ